MNKLMRRLSAAFALTWLSCAAAGAAQWNWLGGCGGNQWYAICTGDECTPGQVWHRNNWLEPVCGPSGIAFPGSGDDVRLDGTAYLDQQVADVFNLDIPAAGNLTVRDGGNLALHGPDALVNGTLWLRWGGYYGNARLTVHNTMLLHGVGSLRSDGGAISGGGTLQVAAGQTIRGRALTIDAAIDNAGTISADEPGTIALTNSPKSNSGVMQAISGGTLAVHSRINQSGAGKIRAEGGMVHLHGGAHLVGGMLETDSASICLLAQEVATLQDFVNHGKLQIDDGATLAIVGSTFQNEGQIALRYGGYFGNSKLRLDTWPVRFAGSGEILISGGFIQGADFEQAATHTIRGYNAVISAGGTNFGLIHADSPGGVMELSGAAKTNRETIMASGGGILRIYTAIDQFGTDGRIVAIDSPIEFYTGAAVTGGTVQTVGSGKLRVSQNTLVLTNVVNAGTIEAIDGAVLALRNGLTNDGTVRVAWGGYYGDASVRFDTNALPLHGTGAMELAGARLFSPGGEVFRNTATHTIHGRGRIQSPFLNEGLIEADAPDGAIVLESNDKSNAGILRAGPGGYLDTSVRIDQANDQGRIEAIGGVARFFNGASILGGTLHSADGGSMSVAQNTLVLTDVTHEGTLNVTDGAVLALRGHRLLNEGEVIVAYGGYFGDATVRFESNDLRLEGAGSMRLAGARLFNSTDEYFRNTAGHTIHGRGLIRAPFENEGLIESDVPGNILTLDGGDKGNVGLIKVSPGAYLDLGARLIQHNGLGRLFADSGTVRLLEGAQILSGKLQTAGTGVMQAAQVAVRLEGVTNEGNLRVGDGARCTLAGGLTNHGTIVVHYGGWAGNGRIILASNLNVIGTGTLLLENGDITGPAGVFLFNGAGHTLAGGGPVGVELYNTGIVAPGNSVGTMQVNAGFTQQAGGLLRIEVSAAATHDRLNVGGVASLDGAIEIRPFGGFIPRAGEQYVVLSAASLAGAFSEVRGPGRYSVANVSNQVVVTVLNGPGDINCDGAVTVSDIGPFVLAVTNPAQYQAQFPGCELDTADLNSDGAVSVGDIGRFVQLLTGG